jgi:hypothetical protein
MATKFEYYITGDDKDVEGLWSADAWLSQSFTPSISHIITSVKLLLLKTGNPGTITVGIYATSGDDPTGSALCSGTTDGDTLPTGSPYEWREITLGDGSLLTAGTKYAILVKALSANITNFVAWRVDSTSPTYSGGTQRHTVNGGGSWSSWGYDLMFEEWSTGSGAISTTAPSVTTQAVTDIDKTTATGNGNVTALGMPEATQHGHCWATHPNPTTANSKTQNGVPSATGAFTSALTGLKANTKYYVRAYITNSVGTSYGAQVTFTTLASTPAVTTDLVTFIAATTALGNGSIDNNGGSAVTQHGVCWGASANPTTADSKTEDGANDVIGEFFSLMTGLTAETTYHYRAYAVNASGTGYGADKTFKTHAAGSPIVTTQRTTNVQAESATGRGTIVDVGGADVTEHGHCWSISANPTTADSKTAKGAGVVEAFTSEITGLTAGTAYYIRAYATNSYGTSYGDHDIINEVAGELKGSYAVLGEWWAYTSKTGKQRLLLGQEN